MMYFEYYTITLRAWGVFFRGHTVLLTSLSLMVLFEERKQAMIRTVEFDAAADVGDRREVLNEHLAAVEDVAVERTAVDRAVVVEYVQQVLA